MIEAYGWWLVRWRYAVILLCLILVGIAASGGRFLQFTSDYRVFFDKENPQLTAFETLQNTYTKNDNVLLVIAPKDGTVFSRTTLDSIEKLTQRAWQMPYSIRVDSITNFQNTRADGDDLLVADLVHGAARYTDAELATIRDIALREPLLVNRLLSRNGHVSAINVTVQLPGKSPQEEVPQVAAYARDLAAKARAENPGLDVHLTGIVMMDDAFNEAAISDMTHLTPIMYLVVFVAIGLLLRVLSGTIGVLLVVSLSIAGAMGLTGWLGIALTMPSVGASTIILTLAVADSVHILVNFLYFMRHGMEKQTAMVESLRVNFAPVFYTSLTNAIGFVTMNFSEVPPFRDLGNIVVIGVVFAWLLSVLFLPALMLVLPVRVPIGETRAHHSMSRFTDFVVANRRWLLWGNAALVLMLGAGIMRNELNDDFVHYFDSRIEFRRATDFTAANLTGIYNLDYSLRAGVAEGVSDPAYLDRLEAFAQWFRQQPEVDHVSVLTDILKRLNKNLHGDDPAWYRLPDKREQSAQYLLLYEMSLPYGLDLNNQINVDKSATRMSVTLKNLSSNEILALERRAQSWLVQNAPPDMQTHGASPAVMFANIGARNIRSMLIGTLMAMILVSLSMVITLRSLKIGLISMIPNLVPAFMGFGLWGYLNGQVGLGLSVVASMTLGIVVDDTIHFLSKYLRARRELHRSPEDSVRYAFNNVGAALWVTSVVLILGFGVMSLSAFEVNAGMGALTAITLALSVAAEFLLLPPLLLKIEEKEYARECDAADAITVEPIVP